MKINSLFSYPKLSWSTSTSAYRSASIFK